MINPALPEFIEPYRLADREVTLEGTYDGSQLPRLAEAVVSVGQLQVKAAFARDAEGYRVVGGAIAGVMQLTCERCLQTMSWDMDTDFELVMVAEEAQLSSAPKRYEPWLVAPGGEVPVTELLEDTVLLAVPQFPMHSPGECSIKMSFGDDEVDTEASSEPDKPNPFSVLAELKSDQKK